MKRRSRLSPTGVHPSGSVSSLDTREEQAARSRALSLLARRDYSERELRRHLTRAGFDPVAIGMAIDRLQQERLVDDAKLAARLAHGQMAHRGLGRHRIRQALKQRGLSREIIEGGLSVTLEEVSEAATLEAVAERYWRAHGNVAPALRARKLHAFLLRRGFPRGLVSAGLKALRTRWKKDFRAGRDPDHNE